MTKVNEKKKKARRITFLLAVLLSIPLGAGYYFAKRDADLSEFTPYPVKPFYVTTAQGDGLTEHQLRQKISLIAMVPANCRVCTTEPSPFQLLEAWAAEHLSYEGMAKVPYLLLAVGALERDAARGLPASWQLVSPATAGSQQNMQDFVAALEQGREQARLAGAGAGAGAGAAEIQDQKEKLHFLFVDEQGEVRAVFDWDEASMSRLTRYWSKLTFNSYLNDYLSKRTFFGVKKNLR